MQTVYTGIRIEDAHVLRIVGFLDYFKILNALLLLQDGIKHVYINLHTYDRDPFQESLVRALTSFERISSFSGV
jgi:hypothetical protein